MGEINQTIILPRQVETSYSQWKTGLLCFVNNIRPQMYNMRI